MTELNTTPENTEDTSKMTDKQIEQVIADSELITAVLAQLGPRHTIATLTMALGVSYVAIGVPKADALEAAAQGLSATFDLATLANEEAKASMN